VPNATQRCAVSLTVLSSMHYAQISVMHNVVSLVGCSLVGWLVTSISYSESAGQMELPIGMRLTSSVLHFVGWYS